MISSNRKSMDKIRVIKRSLRCFAFGWLSLFPILGIAPAMLAMILYKQVQDEVGKEWNPARKEVLLGWALAWCGLFLSLLVLGGSGLLLLRALSEGSGQQWLGF